MPFSRNQRGIIQLGVLGILILAGGLFLASKLASNPDLTFFNIAEEAKNVGESDCKGCVGAYEFRWDRKTNSCKKRSSKICRMDKGINGTAGVIKKDVCKKNSYCAGNIPGSIQCYLQASDTEPGYCCPPGQRDVGNGRCEGLGKCENVGHCYDTSYKGASFCQNEKGENQYCCPRNQRGDPRIGACAGPFSYNLPVCGNSGCSDTKVWQDQENCISTKKPSGQWCCPSGTKLWASGRCQ